MTSYAPYIVVAILVILFLSSLYSIRQEIRELNKTLIELSIDYNLAKLHDSNPSKFDYVPGYMEAKLAVNRRKRELFAKEDFGKEQKL